MIFLWLFQIGGTYAKPVLFVPEVAIGAIGRIQVGQLRCLPMLFV